MIIEQTITPLTIDINFLTHKINKETSEYGNASPFTFFIRNSLKDIIVGCNGPIVYSAIYTDQLWVHPSYRQQGLGRRLMEKVEQHGFENQCHMATVKTMSFEKATPFYEKLGYRRCFKQSGYIQESYLLFLLKHLIL